MIGSLGDLLRLQQIGFKSHSEDRKMGSGKKEVSNLNLNDILFN